MYYTAIKGAATEAIVSRSWEEGHMETTQEAEGARGMIEDESLKAMYARCYGIFHHSLAWYEWAMPMYEDIMPEVWGIEHRGYKIGLAEISLRAGGQQ